MDPITLSGMWSAVKPMVPGALSKARKFCVGKKGELEAQALIKELNRLTVEPYPDPATVQYKLARLASLLPKPTPDLVRLQGAVDAIATLADLPATTTFTQLIRRTNPPRKMAKKATGTGRVIRSFAPRKPKAYRPTSATKKAPPKKATKSVAKKGRPLR